MTLGPGVVAESQIGPPFCRVGAGETWNIQVWYRDPGGTCDGSFNSNDAISVAFTD